MNRLIGLATLTGIVTLATPDAAQQQPTFRARVDLVELDVSVLDKDRRPIRGLKKEDFSVFEDGKPQEVAVFEAIDVPDPEPPAVEWIRDVTPEVTTNEVRPTRLWVIAVDDALIPQEPYAIKTSKQVVRDIIDKLGPEDLATVVFTADSRNAQDFTNDRTKLLATLEKYNPGLASWRGPELVKEPPGIPPPPGIKKPTEDLDQQFWLGAVRTLRSIMDALVVIPHARKNLIWVTPGVPHNAVAPHCPTAPPGPCDSAHAHLRVKELSTEIFAIARRANVPVYPIDPMGLDGMAGWLQTRRDPTLVPGIVARSEDYVLMTASNTGGRAVIKTNDVGPGINAIFEENKSYYSLGYYSTNPKADGMIRRLQVKVNRDDVTIRTRDSYIAAGPKDKPAGSTNEVLSRAVTTSVPIRDLPLRATVAPFAIPGGRLAAVSIALGVRQPVPENAAKERVTVTTELRTTAFTTEGTNKGSQRHSARVTLRAGAQGDADYEALSRIDLPPGRYRLRLAAHHDAAGKTGTVMVDIVVPDFSHDKVSMSGVIVGVTPGRPSAPRNLFTGILPVVPSAQREFTKADRASALFYLYQSTTALVPANIAVRVTDDHGAKLINEAQAIPVERFVTAEAATKSASGRAPAPQIVRNADAFVNKALRAAEFQYPLPIARLPAGRYLLTFEATMGETVLRRDVQFTVKQ